MCWTELLLSLGFMASMCIRRTRLIDNPSTLSTAHISYSFSTLSNTCSLRTIFHLNALEPREDSPVTSSSFTVQQHLLQPPYGMQQLQIIHSYEIHIPSPKYNGIIRVSVSPPLQSPSRTPSPNFLPPKRSPPSPRRSLHGKFLQSLHAC